MAWSMDPPFFSPILSRGGGIDDDGSQAPQGHLPILSPLVLRDLHSLQPLLNNPLGLL